MSSCGCKVTSCKGCVCTQNQRQCNERCKCNPNRCENRPVISHNNQNTAMDQDALTAALAHLMANQQLQQHQFQMQQQQMQQQQDVLTALANRLLAAPAAAVPVVAAPAPAAIIRTTLDSDIRYAGSDNESLQGWLQLINRKALAEGWQDADKRRAAISSLFGKALTWHEEIGINLPQWDDWIGSLRGTFEIQLTESQWQKLVEERKQLPNETGSAYVLDKVKLCRRRAIPINDAEMTPYLIRGLYRPEIRSVLMGNPPATVNDFLVELRRLEAITVSPTDAAGTITGTTSLPPPNTNDNRSLTQVIEALANQVAFLTRTTNQTTSPGPVKPAPKQVTFERRSLGSKNEIQCYNCNAFGHFARDCPLPNARFPKLAANSENGQAAPSRQERQ
ncbi:uncharacterized protein LOC116918142 [Daphnia magna]|uniref:uncharacterized protein LOC116918142 n=1 Tax=Daphnia magna TaxID=35525 RepID=UPI001E1BCF58|nr:uncharacterized protein LOC116918142 [Daphnia magna]